MCVGVCVYLLGHGSSQVPPGAVSRHTHSFGVNPVAFQHLRGQEGPGGCQRIVVLIWEHRLWSQPVTMETEGHRKQLTVETDLDAEAFHDLLRNSD